MAADTLPLEGWMSKLPHTTKGRSLCELALPGAHNAGANAVECISASTLTDYLGPTLGKTLAQSSIIQALAKPVAQIPALCQTDSVGQLLRKGIRLLDLRLGLHDSDKSEIYICHTVVCSTTFRTVLSELRDFLQQNQEELVVLLIKRDWEHPGFDTPENWLRAQQMLEEELDGMLLSQEDIHRSIGSIVEQRRVVLAMLELPRTAAHICGVLATNENLKSSWRSQDQTVMDQMARIEAWRDSGMILSKPGCLKVLELCLPGNPRSSAPKMQRAFRAFLQSTPIHIATKLDFPEPETVEAIVALNWRPLQTTT